MNFCDRLKELREERETSQKVIAERLDICVSAVSKYESGKIYPDVKRLIQLAEMFNVSFDYLLGITDAPIPLRGSKNSPYLLKFPIEITKEQYSLIRKIASIILKTDIKFIKTENFSKRLKRLRIESEISQKEIAINLKISTSAISEYESEKNFPQIGKIIKMAKDFNVSVDYLLGFSDCRYPLNKDRLSPYELILPLTATPEQYRLIQKSAQNVLDAEIASINDKILIKNAKN